MTATKTRTERTIGKSREQLMADVEGRRVELARMTNAQLQAMLPRPLSRARKADLVRAVLTPDLDDLTTIDKERALSRGGAL